MIGSNAFADPIIAMDGFPFGVRSLQAKAFTAPLAEASSQPWSRTDLLYVSRAMRHLAHALWSLQRALFEFDVASNVFAALSIVLNAKPQCHE